MFKKKKKDKKKTTDGDISWMDAELTENNAEQVQSVLRIMKGTSVFLEAVDTKVPSALSHDPEVELQLDETATRFVIQPHKDSESKRGKALSNVMQGQNKIRMNKIETVFLVDIQQLHRNQSMFRRKKKLGSFKSLSMSIIYTSTGSAEIKQKDLYVDPAIHGESELLAWKKGLNYLIKNALKQFQINPMPILVEKAWIQAGGRPQGTVSLNDVDEYYRQNNLVAKKKDIKKAFLTADVDGSGKLEQHEFARVVYMVQEVSIAQEIFTGITKGKRIKADALRKFLQDTQKEENVKREDCNRIIRLMTGASSGFQFDEFATYLTSSLLNSAIHPTAQSVYQNMTYALSHYYINTTRVPADKTIETVTRSLDAGCRAFHVEIYAQGGEPSLKDPQGFRSSSGEQVEVADLLANFRDKAFQDSKYPVILVLELHCREVVQDKLVGLLKTSLGFGLSKDSQDLNPESCRERYLIALDMTKAKDGDSATVSAELEGLATFTLVSFKNGLVPMQKFFEANKKDAGKQVTILQEYQLGLNLERPDHYALFNEKYLSYWVPKTDHANHYSCDAWAAGVQLVGINYYNPNKESGLSYEQVQEEMHRVAQMGRFAQNGRCGYVLKPHTLRRVHVEGYEKVRKARQASQEKTKGAALGANPMAESKTDPQDQDDTLDYNDGWGSSILKLKLISGHRLPKGPAEVSMVYVYIKLIGDASEERDYRSKVVEENGYKPEWHDTFEFKMQKKELAILCFKVLEKGVGEDYLLCQAAVPIVCLRQGYRCLELWDGDGQRVSSQPTLFFHITQEACGDFKSLKMQELVKMQELKKIEEEIDSVQHSIENAKSASGGLQLKKDKLEQETRKYNQLLDEYEGQRFGPLWFNMGKFNKLLSNEEPPNPDMDKSDDDDEEGNQPTQQRDMILQYTEERPFDEPARTCDCLVS